MKPKSIPAPPNLADALACLRRQEVLAYPTEGVFGLGCDARNEAACARVVALKQRRPEQGMIVLVDDWTRLGDWIKPLSPQQQQQLSHHRDSFVTWLFPASASAPPWLTGGHTTLAARRPVWPPLYDLCAAFAAPLLSTSANPHGRAAAADAATVRRYFTAGIDWIWDHPCGGQGRPSSIICLQTGQQLR